MDVRDFDQEDDLTGVAGETVRRAVRRFTSADPLARGCPHTSGEHYTALAESRTWCETCAIGLRLPEVWESWPTCMACGRAIDESTRSLGGAEVLGSVVFMTCCHECAGEFAALRGDRS